MIGPLEPIEDNGRLLLIACCCEYKCWLFEDVVITWLGPGAELLVLLLTLLELLELLFVEFA